MNVLKFPDEVKVCNCARCGAELLSLGDSWWFESIGADKAEKVKTVSGWLSYSYSLCLIFLQK